MQSSVENRYVNKSAKMIFNEFITSEKDVFTQPNYVDSLTIGCLQTIYINIQYLTFLLKSVYCVSM